MNVPTSIAALISCVFLTAAGTTAGQPAQPVAPPATQPRQLSVHPAALTAPAFKYRLMPDPVDLTPGNAASLYLMACSHNLMALKDNIPGEQNSLDEWLNTPPAKIPRGDAERLIERFHGALREIELASRREYCQWDLPIRPEGFMTLLPYLSDMRYLGKLTALRARLQIAKGEFADAAYTLQTGFGMAQHLNRDFIIQMLVGANIGQMMLDQVELWIQTPGAPNLYWALADLPQPFFDNRQMMRGERTSVMISVPYLKEAGEGKLTGDHLQVMLSTLAQATALENEPRKGKLEAISATIARVMEDTPAAKEFLRERGYSGQVIDAMQPPQLLGMYYAMSYDYWIQEMTKWFDLPYPQARAGLARVEEEMRKTQEAHPSNLMMKLLPALSRAGMTAVQFDRRIAELCCLEAVRAYAAGHDGKAPADLQNLPESPAPLDPVTRAPFPYRVENGTAILDAPMPPGGQPKDGRTYRVRVEK